MVTEYLNAAGLTPYLDQLGFNLVGYGCTTCIGNSGPLPEEVSAVIREKNLVVCSVLSGNRNFEGRIQQDVRANYLASPPLVVAYALAGSITKDLTTEPLGDDADGHAGLPEGHLADRAGDAGDDAHGGHGGDVPPQLRRRLHRRRALAGAGGAGGQPLRVGGRLHLHPQADVPRRHDDGRRRPPRDITGARVLALLGDSVTTDHISPAGSIKADSPAGKYLIEKGVKPADFNSYGARRGNHEVMMRGTFANVRLRNQMAPGTEGGWTRYQPGGELMTIYDASVQYQAAGVPLLVIAGKEYGSGSSRDWAAKGTQLLGVKAVIAESFERIHRSNLVNMGVLPLRVQGGRERRVAEADRAPSRSTCVGVADGLKPRGDVRVVATARRRHDARVHGHRAHRHAGGAGGVPPRRHPAVCRAAAGGEEVASTSGPTPRGDGITDLSSEAVQGARPRELGFDLCGIAPVDDFPELAFLREWLDRGYAGEMAWMARIGGAPRATSAPSCRGARSVIVTGTLYNTDRPVLDRPAAGRRAHLALRLGRRLPRRPEAAARRAAGLDARRRRPSRSMRAPTWTPARCRSASTRSTPGSAGSARTPASSTPSSGRGCSWA